MIPSRDRLKYDTFIKSYCYKTFVLLDMDCFNSHGVDNDHSDLYTYEKDRDKALSSLGPRIPTLQVQTCRRVVSQHLLVSGNKVTPCSVGLFTTKEERLQYVLNTAVTQKVLDQ